MEFNVNLVGSGTIFILLAIAMLISGGTIIPFPGALGIAVRLAGAVILAMIGSLLIIMAFRRIMDKYYQSDGFCKLTGGYECSGRCRSCAFAQEAFRVEISNREDRR